VTPLQQVSPALQHAPPQQPSPGAQHALPQQVLGEVQHLTPLQQTLGEAQHSPQHDVELPQSVHATPPVPHSAVLEPALHWFSQLMQPVQQPPLRHLPLPQAVPSAAGAGTHASAFSSQTPTWQASVATMLQSRFLPLAHMPETHVSLSVQDSPSLQLWPSLAAA
jgi:hypothetical protein